MINLSITAKNRIEAQGFTGIDRDTLIAINYWLRLAPAICMVWTAVGVAVASPFILAALVPFALLGGILRGHPFDLIYNFGLRHIFNTPKLPPYGLPRRFACLMASVMLTAMAVAFYFGLHFMGYLLGGTMIFMASINVFTGFCVPSFIYGLIFGKASCELEHEPSEQ